VEQEAKTIQVALGAAEDLGHELESLIVQTKEFPVDERNILLLGYWSLLFDYHKGVLSLISLSFYGSAFALVRPIVEALVKAHLVLCGSDEVVKAIREDKYRVNYATIGPELDGAFGLGGLFDQLMKAREALHSYTHSGALQVARRYDGDELAPRYQSGAILEVISMTTSATFMVTSLVAKHLKHEAAWRKAHELYNSWAG
jgi:hypothetical protein